MAKRLITHTIVNREDDVLYVAKPKEDWSPREVEDVISDLENKQHEYIIQSKEGLETSLIVVNHPKGKYLRSKADSTEDNNLDNFKPLPAQYRLPVYLGNHPSDRESDWVSNIQGVTHSQDHWIFTQLTRILKFHVTTNLNSNKNKAVAYRGMPQELKELGCNHFGDPDYKVVNGQGYIFIPVEGEGEAQKEPRLAVFKDDDELSYVGETTMPKQNKDLGTARAGWVAFNPLDDLLYSSTNQVTESFPIFRYRVDFDHLEQGVVSIEAESDFRLFNANGDTYKIAKYMQGGCFAPNGMLYISNGKESHNEKEGGLHLFLPSGEILFRSSLNRGPFKYEYESNFVHRQEPEGITYWDLDSLPENLKAPQISGQLHAVLLNNNTLSDDAVFFKHYRVTQAEVWK